MPPFPPQGVGERRAPWKANSGPGLTSFQKPFCTPKWTRSPSPVSRVHHGCLSSPAPEGQAPQCHTYPGIRVDAVLRVEAGRKTCLLSGPIRQCLPRHLEVVAASASLPRVLCTGMCFFVIMAGSGGRKEPPWCPMASGREQNPSFSNSLRSQ